MKKNFLFLCVLMASLSFCAAKEVNYMEEKSEVRIQNVLAKIRRGEDVTVAVLGGSITTGYNSNPLEKTAGLQKLANGLKIWRQRINVSLLF